MTDAAPQLAPLPRSRRPLAERLLGLVRTQELFDRSRRGRPRFSDASLRMARSVWFGVGVCGRSVSLGLPVDVLALVYGQEMLRRTLDLDVSHVLVADSNALKSGVAELEVQRAASRVDRSLRTLARATGFPLRVVRASELSGQDELASIMSRLSVPNPYIAEQLGQMELMRRRGSTVKLGWVMSGSTLDESYFDTFFDHSFGESLAYVYTTSGRSLDPNRPRGCPYICERRSERLLLEPDEDIVTKLGRSRGPAAAGYRRLIGKLERAHHRLLGGPRPRRVGETLQALLGQLQA